MSPHTRPGPHPRPDARARPGGRSRPRPQPRAGGTRALVLGVALAVAVAALGLALAPGDRQRRRPGRIPAPPAAVLAPVSAPPARTPSTPSDQSIVPAQRARPRAVIPSREAWRTANRFLRAFTALLYRRSDPEALPDASAAVRQQANGAPDLTDAGRVPAHRLRGPWLDSDLGHYPAPGDLRFRAEVADRYQALELDLELASDPSTDAGYRVVGLGW